MLKDSILKITTEATANRWPFPKTFGELKKLGLISYTVECANFKMIYKWEGGEFVKETGMSFIVSGQFTSEAIKHEIIAHNRDKTTFMDFMNGIVNHGCTHYIVEFANNRVVYYGANKEENHIEHVPGY